MSDHAPFGDVEMMLLEHLAPHGYIVTSTPPDLRERLNTQNVVRVVRAGGGENATATEDQPRVVIHVHVLRDSTVPRKGNDAAEAVRTSLMNLPAITSHGRLDKATTESGPVSVPHPDSEVERLQMIFRLRTRR
jgi:hypothetical protein